MKKKLVFIFDWGTDTIEINDPVFIPSVGDCINLDWDYYLPDTSKAFELKKAIAKAQEMDTLIVAWVHHDINKFEHKITIMIDMEQEL